MNNTVIHCENLSKKYQEGPNQIEVLNNIDFSMQAGERVAIIGPSGSGKSTLLHVLSGLDKPSSGEVYLEGKAWSVLSEQAMCELRNRYFGFVYQFHHLLPEFTALENVMMPGILGQDSVDSAREKATAVLEAVGLGARLQHRPSQLSGGERQRVAIARALVQNPRCVFADEPTGNLDRATAMAVFDMMLSLNKTYRTALLIVTHDQQLAEKMDKIYLLSDKRLILQ